MALVKYNNNSISAVTTTSLATGNLVPISEQTASGSASIEFTTGIDSTYPIYKFEFINIHPANDSSSLQFNLSTDSGSNYNVTKTTTHFYSYHTENDATATLTYDTGSDLAQGTGNSPITNGIGNGNDESASGEMYLFAPSSTTFVKHFISRTNCYYSGDGSIDTYNAGYGNTISSINAIRFQVASGTFDGTIKLYGIKDS